MGVQAVGTVTASLVGVQAVGTVTASLVMAVAQPACGGEVIIHAGIRGAPVRRLERLRVGVCCALSQAHAPSSSPKALSDAVEM